MNNSEIENKAIRAIKWSVLTEFLSKLISPITTIVLARLLTPDAFGVVATITMIVSFAEIFTDAGFQKYLIQHDFKYDYDKECSINVAFWSNLTMSLVIWLLIIYFSDNLSSAVGIPGLGHLIIIACVSIPLAAFSSIQMALYKRDFDFKTLFKVRLIGVFIPIVVTIPLAIITKSYWALIIGTIAKDLCNAIILTYYSKWKPKLYFDFDRLKEMLSFTVWTVFESLSIWVVAYADVFIVSKVLDSYYLGLYKTSMTTVMQITTLITASIIPILFSTLSRNQSDDKKFASSFLSYQHLLALLMLPIGIGLFLYSDLITLFFLGDQWLEAADFIGIFGLTLSLQVVFSYTCSEAYRAKGKPRISLFVQLLYLCFFIPMLIRAAKDSFSALYICRSSMNILLIIINVIVLYFVVKIPFSMMLRRVFPILIASLGMFIIGFSINSILPDNIISYLFSGLLALTAYLLVLFIFPSERNFLLKYIKKSHSYK